MSLLQTPIARSTALQARRALTPRQRQAMSLAICRKLITDPSFSRAGTIACYRAMHDEVDLSLLYSTAWQLGKRVLFPCTEKNGVMFFVETTSKTRWRLKQHAVYEPALHRKKHVTHNARKNDIDIVYAPLSAFDAHFSRVGMGGGYYDRFMSWPQYGSRASFVGIAFACQQTAIIDTQAHDIPLDAIATEATIRFRKRRR